MAISYAKFKRTFGDLRITEWVKFNWLSNAGIGRSIYNKVIEAGYNPLAYVNDGLYNRITKTINIWDEKWEVGAINSSTGENYNGNRERIRSKNYNLCSPNIDYYLYGNIAICWYDINKTFISAQYSDVLRIATSPNNAKYFRIFTQTNVSNPTYNNDICINESDPYINGNYFPYFEGEKFLVLVGEVDLGTLSFSYYNDHNCWIIFSSWRKLGYNNGKAENYSLFNSWQNMPLNSIYLRGDQNYIYVKTNGTNEIRPSGLLDYQLVTPVLLDL